MSDLMTDDGGELVLVGGNLEHAFEHADLAAGQRECIGLFARKDDHLPARRVLTRSREQASANRLKRLLKVAGLRYWRPGTDTLPAFYPQLPDRIVGNELDRKAVDFVTTRDQRRRNGTGEKAEHAPSVKRRGSRSTWEDASSDGEAGQDDQRVKEG